MTASASPAPLARPRLHRRYIPRYSPARPETFR